MSESVKTAVTKVTLPMYRYNEDPFPPLQRTGTSSVYPYPMQDDVTDELTEREFTAVVLDNGLLKVTVLPEFGGHILSVHDIVHDREVFYYNVPLKFGLIALRGAWYSGGIEFNFPQVGHTVTTNDPLSWHLTENSDGSATLFIGTVERLTRMAWTVGITLRPNDWRLHFRVYLFNRTPFWHRIYFWTNTAVPANEDFRFLLPCTQVYSWWWGERGVANFPVHDGQPLNRYTTHKRPTDLFAKDLRADWFGCYYDEQDYGVLHYALRFEVQGRKLWTWGTAEDGLTWANLLNDSGEPYCEIQSGRFVHQGVHRLMPPRAVETWKECWFPVWGLGNVLHATDTVALNAQRANDRLELRLFAPLPTEKATVTVQQGETVLESKTTALSAGELQTLSAPLQNGEPVLVTVKDERHVALQATLLVDGDTVRVDYSDEAAPHIGLPEQPLSEPATPTAWLLKARDHQERNELDAASECYRKALSLDMQCVPAMNGLAQWHLKRGELKQGKSWAQKALQVDPQSDDALWFIGVAGWLDPETRNPKPSTLWALQRSPTYAAAAFALLGELALRRQDYRSALDLFARALEHNPQDSKVLALSAFAARKLGDGKLAQDFLLRCERVNPLEPLLWSERYFLRNEGRGTGDGETALKRIFVDEQLWLETACDYEQVGAWGTVSVWLGSVAKRHTSWHGGTHPMLLYHTAYAMGQMGKVAEALTLVQEGQQRSPLFVFPHRHEDAQALQAASQLDPNDALAHYLLGTWLASVGRWDEAATHWQRTTRLTDEATLQTLTWRNIGVMAWFVKRDTSETVFAYAAATKALRSAPQSPLSAYAWRLWLESDRVLSAVKSFRLRVTEFEQAPEGMRAKPQIIARFAEACLRAGMPERTVSLLSQGNFKPWEGEVAIRQLWKEAQMQLGHQAMGKGDWAKARQHFEAAADYPPNLNVGRPAWTDDADALFWAGWCALRMGDKDAARKWLHQAATEWQPANAQSAGFKAKATELLRTL